LGAERYAPDALERDSANVEWLSPRAVAHDRVLTWASDRGPVIPMPMFSLFSGRAAVQAMLRDRRDELHTALNRVRAGREYALRVYRVDDELLQHMSELSPRLRDLESSAAAATPGQRYLLERKLEREKRGELRAVTAGIVEEIVQALSPHCVSIVRSPIPGITAESAASSGTMVLNAAFLIAPARLEEFQRALGREADRHGSRGFRFDFTGPWPPYHFVGEASHGG
jgi:hypothetical protein